MTRQSPFVVGQRQNAVQGSTFLESPRLLQLTAQKIALPVGRESGFGCTCEFINRWPDVPRRRHRLIQADYARLSPSCISPHPWAIKNLRNPNPPGPCAISMRVGGRQAQTELTITIAATMLMTLPGRSFFAVFLSAGAQILTNTAYTPTPTVIPSACTGTTAATEARISLVLS